MDAMHPAQNDNMSPERKGPLWTLTGTFLCLPAIQGLVLVRGLLTTLSHYREMDRQARVKDSKSTSFDSGDQ
jgi:hypothetical protein